MELTQQNTSFCCVNFFIFAEKTIMKLIRIFFFIVFLISTIKTSFCQFKSYGASFSNNVTSFPVTGYPQLFHSQFHPGIDVSMNWKKNISEKHQLWLTANAGIFYHRFIQTAVRIYPAFDYKYFFSRAFNVNIGLGAGYLHSFQGYEVFNKAPDGTYTAQTIWKSRPQLLAVLNMGCAYKLSKENEKLPSLFLQLHSNLQGPFVNSYVPMLPINSIHLGVLFPIINKK